MSGTRYACSRAWQAIKEGRPARLILEIDIAVLPTIRLSTVQILVNVVTMCAAGGMAPAVIIERSMHDSWLSNTYLVADEVGSHAVMIDAGGPVEPELGFVVHSAEYQTPHTLDIDGRVALTIAPEVLRDIGLDKGPRKSLAAFGYAGWAPAQLDNELAHGVWITMPEDPALVFDDDRANLWDDARARQKTGQ